MKRALPRYYRYKEIEFSCKKCKWKGKGSEADDDADDYGMPILCPKCYENVGYVMYPTQDEVLEFGSEKDKEGVRKRRKFVKEAEESKLKPDPFSKKDTKEIVKDLKTILGKDMSKFIVDKVDITLPKIDSKVPFKLKWSLVRDDQKRYTVVMHENQEIWRELAYYEGYYRFGDVAKILQNFYGVERMKDLIPMPNSELYLYGDALRSLDYVEEIRGELKTGIL